MIETLLVWLIGVIVTLPDAIYDDRGQQAGYEPGASLTD